MEINASENFEINKLIKRRTLKTNAIVVKFNLSSFNIHQPRYWTLNYIKVSDIEKRLGRLEENKRKKPKRFGIFLALPNSSRCTTRNKVREFELQKHKKFIKNKWYKLQPYCSEIKLFVLPQHLTDFNSFQIKLGIHVVSKNWYKQCKCAPVG